MLLGWWYRVRKSTRLNWDTTVNYNYYKLYRSKFCKNCISINSIQNQHISGKMKHKQLELTTYTLPKKKCHPVTHLNKFLSCAFHLGVCLQNTREDGLQSYYLLHSCYFLIFHLQEGTQEWGPLTKSQDRQCLFHTCRVILQCMRNDLSTTKRKINQRN